MANEEHLAILNKALELDNILYWNFFRQENPAVIPDLSNIKLDRVNLQQANLQEANLSRTRLQFANLSKANLNGANLTEAQLSVVNLNEASLRFAILQDATLLGADLRNTVLVGANLTRANMNDAMLNKANLANSNLHGANLSEANLSEVNLHGANLSNANLYKSNLVGASLVGTVFSNATLEDCNIYGISAWDINLEGATQKDLNISREGQAHLTVDNLKIAQFIYLILNNAEIRDVIDTIGKKVVLILGRFTRKDVLLTIKEELRKHDYISILFDFDKPPNRDYSETVRILAHLSRFIIVDLTDPNSSPHEMMSFAEQIPSVPIQPIFQPQEGTNSAYPMLEHFYAYRWVLKLYEYENTEELISQMYDDIIVPVERKTQVLAVQLDSEKRTYENGLLQDLMSLRDAGFLTEEEFESKKAKLIENQ